MASVALETWPVLVVMIIMISTNMTAPIPIGNPQYFAEYMSSRAVTNSPSTEDLDQTTIKVNHWLHYCIGCITALVLHVQFADITCSSVQDEVYSVMPEYDEEVGYNETGPYDYSDVYSPGHVLLDQVSHVSCVMTSLILLLKCILFLACRRSQWYQ